MARRAPTLSAEAILDELRNPSITDTDEVTGAMLDAASSLLASYGMKRWSMEDVADRAGLGRTTVYRHFDSRDDLVHAALARDARRLFAAIAATVAGVDGVDNKLVEGLLVGLRAARSSLIPGLFASDTSAALSLLTSPAVLSVARSSLVDIYEGVAGTRLQGSRRTDVELVAETVLRLAMSFVLVPGSVIDLDDDVAARRALRRIVGPLVVGRS